MLRKVQGYGWIPDHPDQRDYLYQAPNAILRSLPPSVDLRPACPPIYRQGYLGSCTANVVAAAVQFEQIKQRRTAIFMPSRLFIYYNARLLEGTVDSDSGASIRDGMNSVFLMGACPEAMWLYDEKAFRLRPIEPCYQVAAWHKTVRYQRVSQELNQMRGCLASGYPFAFGFTVYQSFESSPVAASGRVPLPTPGESTVGSHAALAVGYDDERQWFIARNSYGAGWGMGGYFTLPYSYLTRETLASDFWLIELVQ